MYVQTGTYYVTEDQQHNCERVATSSTMAASIDIQASDALFAGARDAEKRAQTLSYIATSLGNFSVQYNFQSISVAMLIMASSVCTTDDADCRDDIQDFWIAGTATAVIFAGAITGQLTMGYIGDVLGRNAAYVLTLSLCAFGAVASAAFSYGSSEEIYGIIIACRFILGAGAGGVFPLSSAKAAEDQGSEPVNTNAKATGGINVVAASKAMFYQSPGALAPWFLGFCMTYADIPVNDKWRLVLGCGAVPAVLVVLCTLWEIRVRDTVPAAKAVVTTEPSVEERQRLARKGRLLRDPKYQWRMIITGGGWFIYDVAFYGVSLFGGVIVNSIKTTDDDNVSSDAAVRYATSHQLIANLMGVPAAITTIYAIKYFGTKRVQCGGFLFQAFMFFLMASTFYSLKRTNDEALFAIYCFLIFSLTSGSSMTTFCLPAQYYPYEIRTTYAGMSAAMGKLGAAVGAFMVRSALHCAALHPSSFTPMVDPLITFLRSLLTVM